MRAFAVARPPDAANQAAQPMPPAGSRRRRRRRSESRRPRFVLVFDCETSIDETQRLLFGLPLPRPALGSDGPELSASRKASSTRTARPRDPAAVALIAVHCQSHPAATDREPVGLLEPRPDLRLRTRESSVDEVFLPALEGQATVVAFNAPYDLTRSRPAGGAPAAQGIRLGSSTPSPSTRTARRGAGMVSGRGC